MKLSTKERNRLITEAAARLASDYRALAAELESAAHALDQARGIDSALPVVRPSRLVEALRLGVILHHLAERP
ncbi:MAG: hypothetical protein ACOY3N_23160 [Bradyrhizobium sp.]|uniref:hypothetical protein n=1 Tax=Bradyrhizobium sp. TaxID=376 RepID=UPI003BF13776